MNLIQNEDLRKIAKAVQGVWKANAEYVEGDGECLEPVEDAEARLVRTVMDIFERSV